MVNIRQVSPELLAKAQNELHEEEGRIPQDIAILKDWIAKQPHLKARTDDQFLVNFLRGAKYSLEKAKQKLNFYYTIRSLSPDFFMDKIVDDRVIQLSKLGCFVPLPKPLTSDGPRLHITRFNNLESNDFTFVDVLKYQLRILDIETHEDDNVIIGGTINIVDLSNITFRLIMQFEPSLMKKLSVFMEKAVPLRIKGVHVINMPKEAVAVMNLFRSILPKKINDRVVIHSSLENLYEYFPKELLPTEYGGTNGSIQETIDDWVQRMIDHKQFFEDEKQYSVDERLRPGDPVTSESLFGLDGSFRKLQVD